MSSSTNPRPIAARPTPQLGPFQGDWKYIQTETRLKGSGDVLEPRLFGMPSNPHDQLSQVTTPEPLKPFKEAFDAAMAPGAEPIKYAIKQPNGEPYEVTGKIFGGFLDVSIEYVIACANDLNSTIPEDSAALDRLLIAFNRYKVAGHTTGITMDDWTKFIHYCGFSMDVSSIDELQRVLK